MEKYGIIAVLLIVLSMVYMKIADKFNIIDKPNHRSSHTIPTIRGGGSLFLFALWIYFIISDFTYPYLVLGVSLIAIVSFVDDIKTLSSKVRFPFQLIAVILVFQEMGLFDTPWWSLLLIAIVGVGFINFYNFMDGINGITGLYSLAVFSGLYVINQEVLVIDQDLLRIVMISLVVFGYYNFRKKARCFAGDIGSISIAVILFYVGTSLVYKLNAPVIILCSVVYGVDTIITLFYRKYLGEKLTDPHRHHIYQKLVDVSGLSHMKVAISYFMLQLGINIVVLATYQKSIQVQLITFCCVVLVCISLYLVIFNYLKSKKLSEA